LLSRESQRGQAFIIDVMKVGCRKCSVLSFQGESRSRIPNHGSHLKDTDEDAGRCGGRVLGFVV
jgi:hypothetical protein